MRVSPPWVVVNMLAAYRLTRLWLKDDLPPLPAVRAALGRRFAAYEQAHEGEPHPLEPLTDCPWCAGFWISAATVLADSVPVLRRVWRPLALALASSAVVGHLSLRDE